jgi:two-component system sensor histidine kinase MtrB
VHILRLTLRWRVATAFGLGSLLLTGILAVATWNLAGDYMQRQRELSTVRQAEVNARLVANSLRTGAEGLDELLAGLSSESTATAAPGTSGMDHQRTSGRPGGTARLAAGAGGR